jgi:uncharacterized protein YceH (UPF0502 family)
LLGDAAALTQAAQAGERVQTSAEAPSSTGLEARVAELERRISALEAELGL